MSGTEQRGVCAGGKKPTARSINRILKLFESFKIRTAGRKYFFDTLNFLVQSGGLRLEKIVVGGGEFGLQRLLQLGELV